MIKIKDGIVETNEGLVISPTYTFDQFAKTKFFNNYDRTEFFYLEETHTINNRNYYIGLTFSDDSISMVVLICCDEDFDEVDEPKRKILHDKILEEIGIVERFDADWGNVVSTYDNKSNISCICVCYNK